MRTLTGSFAAATFTLGILLGSPVGAIADDDDQDGVADELDACIDTPSGDITAADGCSVCPCEGPADGSSWGSHDGYLKCVADAIRVRKHDRTMSRKAARNALRIARKATCGNEALTRCCIFPSDQTEASDTVVGKCRIMSVDQCDELTNRLDWAEDADPGSCLPNPCVF